MLLNAETENANHLFKIFGKPESANEPFVWLVLQFKFAQKQKK